MTTTTTTTFIPNSREPEKSSSPPMFNRSLGDRCGDPDKASNPPIFNRSLRDRVNYALGVIHEENGKNDAEKEQNRNKKILSFGLKEACNKVYGPQKSCTFLPNTQNTSIPQSWQPLGASSKSIKLERLLPGDLNFEEKDLQEFKNPMDDEFDHELKEKQAEKEQHRQKSIETNNQKQSVSQKNSIMVKKISDCMSALLKQNCTCSISDIFISLLRLGTYFEQDFVFTPLEQQAVESVLELFSAKLHSNSVEKITLTERDLLRSIVDFFQP